MEENRRAIQARQAWWQEHGPTDEQKEAAYHFFFGNWGGDFPAEDNWDNGGGLIELIDAKVDAAVESHNLRVGFSPEYSVETPEYSEYSVDAEDIETSYIERMM